MKTIAVLVDFTEGSKLALKQAASLVMQINGKLVGVHIVPNSNRIWEAEEKLTAFMKEQCDTGFEICVSPGSLIPAAKEALKKVSADMVIICTHGIKGMFQHLFGAQILKMVQALPYPTLVIHSQQNVDIINTHKILFPIGPNPDYMTYIEQTAMLAQLINAEVTLYEINRPGEEYDEIHHKAAEMAKTYFERNNIKYSRVVEDVNFISVGHYRQTIEYAKKHGYYIISVMATVSNNEMLFGYGDKENYLVNEQGITILTCNK